MATGQREKGDMHTQGAGHQGGQHQGGQNQGGMGNRDRDAEAGKGGVAGMASSAVSAAKDMASTVAGSAGDAASFVGRKAEDATSGLASGMRSLAGTIREHTPDKGMFGSAGSTVADTLESSGRYLQEHGLSGIGDDMTNMIRRNPIPAVLIGIGIGFLLARATRS